MICLFFSSSDVSGVDADGASVSVMGGVENSVLLKCRKLRREDQETSDSIVGFFIEKKTQCDGRLQSSKSPLKSFLQGIFIGRIGGGTFTG